MVFAHACVALCAGPYCPILPQTTALSHPPAVTHKARTRNCCCARRMASDLAGRRRSGRRLHGTTRGREGHTGMGEARRGWAHLTLHASPAAVISGGYTVRSRVPGGGGGWGGRVSGGKVGSAGGAGWAARRVCGAEAAVRSPVMRASAHFPHPESRWSLAPPLQLF